MTRLEGFIDHFENDVAVINKSDYSVARVSRQALPVNVHEGDFVVEQLGQSRFIIEAQITEAHHREIRRMVGYFFD